jgi:hypothetical protein
MTIDVNQVIRLYVPGLCIALAIGGLVVQSRKIGEAEERHAKAQKFLSDAIVERDQVLQNPAQKRYAAAEQQPFEESEFIKDIRRRAGGQGATIVKWTAGEAAAPRTYANPDGKAETSSETEADPALANITTVASQLTVSGNYDSLRRFLGDLVSADRLYTINNVNWNRADDATELSFSLTRYTSTASAPGAAAQEAERLLN